MKKQYLRGAWICAMTLGVAMLASCSLLQNVETQKLATQYATVKVINDSDSITAQDVMDRVESMQALFSDNYLVAADELMRVISNQINFDALSEQDQYLVQTLITTAVQYIKESSPVPDEVRVRVLTVLSWIHEAAQASARESSA